MLGAWLAGNLPQTFAHAPNHAEPIMLAFPRIVLRQMHEAQQQKPVLPLVAGAVQYNAQP
jgi:hypothetical protein